MATLRMPDVDEVVHERLRRQAAEPGRSVEAEVRALLDVFGSWVVPLDERAHATAHVLASGTSVGRVMGTVDAQIAGIALAAGSALATRNAQDFAGVGGLRLIDPLESSS